MALGQGADDTPTQPLSVETTEVLERSEIASLLRDLISVLDFYSREAAKGNYTDDLKQSANRTALNGLAAQQRIAFSTEFGIWINTFGLIILALALIYNYQATKAATKAANAAAEQVKGNRAWITRHNRLDRSEMTWLGNIPVIDFTWKNTGHSPAINVRHKIGRAIMPKISSDNRPDVTVDGLEPGGWHVEGTVGAGAHFSIDFKLSGDAWPAVQSDEDSFVVYLKVAYNTTFDEIVHTSEALIEVIMVTDSKDVRGIHSFPIGTNHTCT